MWFRRSDRDFGDEIESHIVLETDRLIATGMAPREAREAATRAFGNRTIARERFRESRGWLYIEHIARDLGYAARAMQRAPGFAIFATLCLAIGISVNTAAFSVLNAVLFRDYHGVERQDELLSMLIGIERREGRTGPSYASLSDWDILRTGMKAFTGIAAFGNVPLSASVNGEVEAVRGALVSTAYFDVLGTRPARGRFMTANDLPRDIDQGIVISHAYWTRRFNARPDIAGRVITVGTRLFTIVGVAPEGFFGLYPGEVLDPDIGAAELFVPLSAAPFVRAGVAASLDDQWLTVFGRLRPDAARAEAEQEANTMASRIAEAYPAQRPKAFAVLNAAGNRAKDAAEMAGAMVLVMVVPVILLLVACANLANQLLARAIERTREIAVRLSLGATRGRVVRQLLVETALLAIIASGMGILLARWLLDAIRAFVLPLPFRIPIDGRVLVFTIGLGLLTAFAFGLAPALRASRTDLTSALKDGTPGGGYRRSRLRNTLVIVQIAASLALIAVSSVFGSAGRRPPSAALDELSNHAILVSMNLDLLAFTPTTGRAYQRLVMERVGQVPGVSSVGMAPFSMFQMLGGERIAEPGKEAPHQMYEDVAEVSGAWFEATSTRPVRGRLFNAAERVSLPTVAVVDEAFARDLWGETEALGRTLRIGEDSAASFVTVIGVVPERREVAFREAEGVVFIPGTRAYNPQTFFYVRTHGNAAPLIPVVDGVIRAVDPRVPILWVRTLEDVGAREVAAMTMLASGLATLGAVGFGLAALGLFGVLSFIVAQRRHEIGIRVALGARSQDVTWMVLRQALGLGAGGVLAGGVIAMFAVALLRAIIHGLEPLDLAQFATISVLMVLVALIASVLPAWRAASVDPMTVLRAD